MSKRTPLPAPVNGASITYAPANQAYVISWHNQILRIITDKDEAIAYFKSITE